MHEQAAIDLQGHAGKERRVWTGDEPGDAAAIAVDIAEAAHGNHHTRGFRFGREGLLVIDHRILLDRRVDDFAGDPVLSPLAKWRCDNDGSPDPASSARDECGLARQRIRHLRCSRWMPKWAM